MADIILFYLKFIFFMPHKIIVCMVWFYSFLFTFFFIYFFYAKL